LVQFRQLASSANPDTEETYVMGNRLVSFLSEALPRHPEYRNTALQTLRTKSFQDLIWIQEQMEEIAMSIDEEQLNHYVMHDFDPLQDDLSASSAEDNDSDDLSFSDLVDTNRRDTWESFEGGGWSFDLSSGDEAVPVGTDTDVSSVQSHEANRSRDQRRVANRKAAVSVPPLPVVVVEDIKIVHDEVADSDIDLYVNLDPDDDDDDDDDSDDEPILRYSLKDSIATSILNRIADEDVCFETDSEAVDSWAQDGDSNALSGASSGTALTCDPARIAFREIMNRIPRTGAAYSRDKVGTPPPPPPPVPTNSPAVPSKVATNKDHETAAVGEHGGERWSKFAFSSVRTAGEQ
jgi:hypothetical protein